MKNLELKIYEALGIRQFRKLAFKFRDKLTDIIMPFKSKKRNETIFFTKFLIIM